MTAHCRNCNGTGLVEHFTVWLTVEYCGHEWQQEGGRFDSLEQAMQRYKDKREASKLGLLDDHIAGGKVVDEAKGFAVYEFSGWDRICRVSYPHGRYRGEDIGGLF